MINLKTSIEPKRRTKLSSEEQPLTLDANLP
jgi:hypothetical protein